MDKRDISQNLRWVHEKMATAALRAGRQPEDVKLIAVSKTKPISTIEEAFRAGQTCFGENYVQEALAKIEALPQAEWHLIGSLQSKKAKQVIGRFALIHSVDRLSLAEQLNQAAAKLGIVQEILIQVHLGNEPTKHGVEIAQGGELIAQASRFKYLRLRGLMSLPPLTESESVSRAYFAILREAAEQWKAQMSPEAAQDFSELSMGTSGDFEWAILEGATLVRVGTRIFGEREMS